MKDKILLSKCFFLVLAVLLTVGWAGSGPARAAFYLREEAKPMWLKADTNHDGYLSRPEIFAEDPVLLRDFDQADVDKNGKLDLGEFEILLIGL